MSTKRIPQIGDTYYSGFESDYLESGGLPTEGGECRVIADVWGECDDGRTWSIEADNGIGYDCIWSDALGAWVYNLG